MVSLSSADTGRLPLRQWLIGARLGATLAALGVLVKLAGFHRSVRIAWWFADRMPEPPSETRTPFVLAETRAQEIKAVAERIPYEFKCLPQSMLLAMLMRRRGIAADLCLGVKLEEPFEAHAWLEVEGAPVNQGETLAGFRCLHRVPTVSK